MSTSIPLLHHQWITGKLIKRYKRFLADVRLSNTEVVTAHCPNTGAMLGLCTPQSTVFLSKTPTSKTRKLMYTWEAVQVEKTIIGVNTHLPNRLIHRALQEETLLPFKGYTHIKKEVLIEKGWRVDFVVENPQTQQRFLIEVKNVHYDEKGVALFPDSPTTRGQKHIDKLCGCVTSGFARAAIVYIVQRDDCMAFDFCAARDPLYTQKALHALKQGVAMYAYSVRLTAKGASLHKALPFKTTTGIS